MEATEIISQANTQQPQLIRQFKQAVVSDQLAHAFLFVGPQGRGQKLVADWLAMRLMCAHPTADGEPDGVCSQCLRIANGNHPDVIDLKPDGHSIKIDQVRFLKDEFTKTAVEGRRKIFVIEGADTMTASAANGLLKFIEEPVGEQTAILLAENRQQILPTVISRTQVVDFPNLGQEMYTRQLQELGYTDTNIALAAELTDSFPVAETWLADDWFNQSVITISEITGKLLQLDVEAFNLVQTDIMKLSSGTSSHQLLVHMLAAAWRDVILSASNALDTPHFKQSHEWGQYAQRYPMAKLLAVQRIIFTANETLAMNVNLQTTMESVILESQFELGGK